jgi:hypothetical protein
MANAMSFNAAVAYYSKEPNSNLQLSLFIAGIFGISYGVGALRLFKWGFALNNYKLYLGLLPTMVILQSWLIYMSHTVQKEYPPSSIPNPINTSLSYLWKAIP